LRELGENFTYSKFKRELDGRTFNPAQRAGLDQRLTLLESLMAKAYQAQPKNATRFSAGVLTIIDLTDPFIDPDSACGLFHIITRLFIRAQVDTGKVLVVDEAHKVKFLLVLLYKSMTISSSIFQKKVDSRSHSFH
jgi:hypothetical protein